MVATPGLHEELRSTLKSVSRSFYLTLAMVPSAVRSQVSLAYLLARAADTLADTDLIPHGLRLQALRSFRGWVGQPAGHQQTAQSWQDALACVGPATAEGRLLGRLEDCWLVLHTFNAEDQALIREVLDTLTTGMERDLLLFTGDSGETPRALKSLDDLDRYTYEMAGCVGEFWTRLMHAHLPSLRRWDVESMAAVGVRFGKGLQLTNVLRDLPVDLRRGRCYIPEEFLNEAGLKPADLLDAGSLPQFQPILSRLLSLALEHLDQGWLYTMAIPRRELRLRLACAWPILFALKTLQRISASARLLDPAVTLKMTRMEVYRDIVLSTATLGCGRLLTGYYGRLRKTVAC